MMINIVRNDSVNKSKHSMDSILVEHKSSQSYKIDEMSSLFILTI